MLNVLEELKLEFSEFKKSVQKFIGKKLKFAEVTTTDGKILSYDGELAEGTAVMIDGAPAADGAYTLEDGTTCNVEGGVIKSITKPMGNEYAEKFAALEKNFADFVAKYEEENTSRNGRFDEIGKILEGLTGQLGKHMEAIEKFSAVAADPAEAPVSRKDAKMIKEANTSKRINDILEEINKAK